MLNVVVSPNPCYNFAAITSTTPLIVPTPVASYWGAAPVTQNFTNVFQNASTAGCLFAISYSMTGVPANFNYTNGVLNTGKCSLGVLSNGTDPDCNGFANAANATNFYSLSFTVTAT